MIKAKINNLIKLSIVGGLTLGFTTGVIAETTKSGNANYGFPTHRRDGGSRGDNCLAHSNNLVALIPENYATLNASASPKLFFFVPEIKNQKVLEFVLRNEQDELVYEAFLTTNEDGIIDIEIPQEIQSGLFEKNSNYHWYLSMICNSKQRSHDIVVQGWLRRSDLNATIQKQLNSSTVVEQANIYQKEGFWLDALSVLAASKETAANNNVVSAKWSELLDSVDLRELASKPFVDSKLVKNPYKLEANRNSWLPE